MSSAMESGGMADRRTQLLAGLSGDVIEIGAGTGANFRHYPAAVSRVLAIEPEPRLRARARAAAEDVPVPIEVTGGVASALPVSDASYDAAVVAFVLCSINQDAALAEIRRVLRPGGRLYFLEHVRADTPGLRRAQRALDATVWPRMFGGCHLGRDTAAAIARAGFTISALEEFLFPDPRTPVSFHVSGQANAPGG